MSIALRGGECLLRVRDSAADLTYLLVEGVRVNGWKISQQEVDVTDLAGGAWRRLLSGAGIRSLEVRLQGMYLASPGELLLREKAFSGLAFEAEFTLEAGAAVKGHFVASELSFDSAVNEEATYAATLQSAGPITLN